tara:strand:- start:1589 stop:1690 length:102 start_codon:yes stop_codon:yes gene_type:complete
MDGFFACEKHKLIAKHVNSIDSDNFFILLFLFF